MHSAVGHHHPDIALQSTPGTFAASSRRAPGTHPSRWADCALREVSAWQELERSEGAVVEDMAQQGGDRRLPLPSLDKLAWRCDVPREHLSKIVSRQVFPYVELAATKRSGKARVLHSPEPRLMTVQRHLLSLLTHHRTPHPAAYAYRPGVSILDCATVHLRAHTVVRLDIADFYPSIKERHVFQVFHDPKRSRFEPYQLTCLTTVSPGSAATWRNRGTGHRCQGDDWVPRRFTYEDQREGFLPQGAPTSGILSNLVMRSADERVFEIASHLGLRFTRYSDDLYFSSRRPVRKHMIDRLIREVRVTLAKDGFHLNDKKTWVAGPGGRRSVLGILVDGPSPRLPRQYKRNVEVHLRGAALNGMDQHAQHRDFTTTDDLDAHVTGLLSHARLVEPTWSAEHWRTWQRLRSLAMQPELALTQPPELGTTSAEPQPDGDAASVAAAKASIDALIRGGHHYRRSTDYAEMVRFVGRFHWYAPYNAMLVHLQRPGTRFVATEQRWRDDFRRAVRPGAQPLVILQPGGPFMVVFDVGDSEALPGAPPLPSEVTNPLAVSASVSDAKLQALWDRTVMNAVRDGVRVTVTNHGGGAAGKVYWSKLLDVITRPGARGKGEHEHYPLNFEIEVNSNLPLIDRYATLVHELAHLYCGHIGTQKRGFGPIGAPVRRPATRSRRSRSSTWSCHVWTRRSAWATTYSATRRPRMRSPRTSN